METLTNFINLEISLLLLAIWFIIMYQLVTGKINTDGMARDKKDGGMSPGRLQLLFFTFIGVFFFVVQAMKNPGVVPEIPPALLVLLGGSNVVYLGGKANSMLSRLGKEQSKK